MKRSYITVTCDWCGAQRQMMPCRAARSVRHFCLDKDCKAQWQVVNLRGKSNPCWRGGQMVTANCAQCGAVVHRKRSEVAKYTLSFCNCKCRAAYRSENERGELATNWRGGLTAIRQLWAQSPEGRAWAKAVKHIGNHTCAICGATGTKEAPLDAHHKARWTEYPECRLDIANGIPLCRTCHMWLHSKHGEYLRTAWRDTYLQQQAAA